MTNKIKRKNSQSGYSIVELMISLGILGVASVIGFGTYIRAKKSVDDITVVNAMRKIAGDVEVTARQASSLAFSAWSGRNPELLNCVYTWSEANGNLSRDKAFDKREIRKDKDPTLCTKTDPEKQEGVHLYKVPGDWKNANMQRLRIAGTPSEPVWYTISGQKDCNPVSDPARCKIRAVAWMWATCSTDSNIIRQNQAGTSGSSSFRNSCYRARTVHIRYQIRYVENFSIFSRNAKKCNPYPYRFHAIPNDRTFWGESCGIKVQNSEIKGFHRESHSSKHSFAVTVSGIGRYADRLQSCPKNYTLLGIKDSEPQCVCMAPYSELQTGLSKTCILDNHRCKANQRYLGTDLDGSPICQDIHCFYKTIDMSQGKPLDFSCTQDDSGRTRKGGWINEITAENKNGGNCECANTQEAPDMEIMGWSYGCLLQCSFTVRCCFEKK